MKNKITILGIVLTIVNLNFAGSVFDSTPLKNSDNRIDRVNLWPVFYYQNPNMSVFWPLIDKRNDGHAFRPLYSVYNNGDELNILWPFASFDFLHREYRVANVYYDKPDELFIFPISSFNFHRHKYWFLNTYADKNSFIFFPMYFYEKDEFWLATLLAGKGKNWYSVMPPVWISSYNTTNNNFYFFGPLGIYNFKDERKHEFSALFKLIDYEKENNYRELNILFLNNYIKDKHYKEINFFYISNYTKTKRDKNFYFFPLVYLHRGSNYDKKVIFPLYFSKKDKKKDYKLFIPLFYKNNKEKLLITPLFGMLYDDETKSLITPLLSYKKGKGNNFMNILGPVFNHIENKEKEYEKTDVVWPIFNYTHKKDKKSVSAFPVFYKSSSSNENVFITLLFATINGDEKKEILTPLISFGKKEKSSFINVLGFGYNRFVNSEKNYKRTDVIWPLFNHTFNNGKKQTYFFPLFDFKRSAKRYKFISPIISFGKDYKNKNNFINIAGILFHYRNSGYSTRGFFLWPLYEYGFRKNGSANHSILFDFIERDKNIYKRSIYDGAINDDEMITQKFSRTFVFKNFKSGIRIKKNYLSVPNELRNTNGFLCKRKIKENPEIWQKYAKKNWWRQKYLEIKLPLIFSYKNYEKEYTHFDILYWLYESDRTAKTGRHSEKVNRKILWKIMNYNRTGNNVTLDVFPFITYDKAPEKEITQFSFFWRLFRWRSEKQKRALDILFVPIRWENK